MKASRITFYALGTLVLTLAIGFAVGRTTRADAPAVPGSADDPVVTKSYVDARIQALLGSNGANTGSKNVETSSSIGTGSQPAVSTAAGNGFQVVLVPAGKKVVAATPSGLEVIVRTGTVNAVAGSLGGLSDLTSGADLESGAVQANHYIVLARNDGRGLNVSADSFMLIRGGYNLQ